MCKRDELEIQDIEKNFFSSSVVVVRLHSFKRIVVVSSWIFFPFFFFFFGLRKFFFDERLEEKGRPIMGLFLKGEFKCIGWLVGVLDISNSNLK